MLLILNINKLHVNKTKFVPEMPEALPVEPARGELWTRTNSSAVEKSINNRWSTFKLALDERYQRTWKATLPDKKFII